MPMIRTLFALAAFSLLALLGWTQEVPLGDVARANKQKSQSKQPEAASAQPAEKPKAKRVFTNDDVVASPAPPPAAAPTETKTERASRRYKQGIPIAEALRRSSNISSEKSVVVQLERRRRELEAKPDKSAQDRAEMARLDSQIATRKEQIAKAEAALYE